MRNIVFPILVTIGLIACEKEKVLKAEETGLHKLRIRNETPYLFDNVYVKIGDSENNYGSVKPYETSVYKSFDQASYPFFIVSMQGQEAEFQIRPFEAPPAEVKNKNTVSTERTCVIHINELTNGLG